MNKKATAATERIEMRDEKRMVISGLRITHDGYTETAKVRAPDLSPRGIFVNTPRPYSPGAMVWLRFELPLTEVIVQALGEVRYCIPDVGIGVEFYRIAEEARGAIRREMQMMTAKQEARGKGPKGKSGDGGIG